MFTRMTLAAKLRLLTTGAVLLTTLLVLTIAVTRTITDSYQRLSRKGDTLAQMVAQNSEFAVYTQDVEALRKITQGLRADAEVAYVRFIAADGRTLLQEVLLPDVTFPSAPAGPGRPGARGRAALRRWDGAADHRRGRQGGRRRPAAAISFPATSWARRAHPGPLDSCSSD